MTHTFTGGWIPMEGSNELRLLNTGQKGAEVELTVFYGDRDPVGPYRIEVAAQRLRVVRINDLIDPLPVPLETRYALTVRCPRSVMVEFDTGRR